MGGRELQGAINGMGVIIAFAQSDGGWKRTPRPVFSRHDSAGNGRRGEGPPSSRRAARRARSVLYACHSMAADGAPRALRSYPEASRMTRDGTRALNVPTPFCQNMAGTDTERGGSS